MSESKHTQGPFVAEKASQGHYEIIAPNAPKSKRRVARLGGPDRYGNAHLFAAAPDMEMELEVREGDLVMLRRAILEDDPKPELLVRVEDMLRETRACLAKAEGRTDA